MSQIDLSQQALMLSRGATTSQGWFPPGEPLKPMAPADFGWFRTHDYDIATNVTITPKVVDKGLTYRQLRNLAESSDYISIAIQTVLDRLCATEGRVVDVGGDPRKPSKRADEINAWSKRMDGVTPLSDFLQRAAYDMCVIDAPAAAVIKDDPKNPIAYNMDGASIIAHINERGQWMSMGQVIKGQIAHEYSVDEIILMPKNRRPHKIYGFSPVEQIQNVVAISLKRMARQMDWFGKGNIPDVLFVAPEGWTPQQIKEVNQVWAKQLAGINGSGKGHWIPPGTTVEELGRSPTAGEFDEWLVRVIFAAFSLPPTPFVKQINRATSESMQDASVEEGHAAVLRWAANFLTAIITSAHGPGFEWMWNLAKPTKGETIELLKAGVLKPAAATRLGFDPEEIAETLPNAAKPGVAPEKTADKVTNADTPDELTEHTAAYLERLRSNAEAAAEARFQGKDADPDLSAPPGWRARAEVILTSAALDGVEEAMTQIITRPESMSDVVTTAKGFARARSGEMVGKKLVGGKWIDNPNAKWSIPESTREVVRAKVEQAFEQHWTPSELSQEIAKDRAFGPLRANNIARFETAQAQEVGSMAYFRASGVTGKSWSHGDNCPICKGNAAQGVIPINQLFQSGHDHAPAHPGCVCRTIPEELPE